MVDRLTPENQNFRSEEDKLYTVCCDMLLESLTSPKKDLFLYSSLNWGTYLCIKTLSLWLYQQLGAHVKQKRPSCLKENYSKTLVESLIDYNTYDHVGLR